MTWRFIEPTSYVEEDGTTFAETSTEWTIVQGSLTSVSDGTYQGQTGYMAVPGGAIGRVTGANASTRGRWSKRVYTPSTTTLYGNIFLILPDTATTTAYGVPSTEGISVRTVGTSGVMRFEVYYNNGSVVGASDVNIKDIGGGEAGVTEGWHQWELIWTGFSNGSNTWEAELWIDGVQKLTRSGASTYSLAGTWSQSQRHYQVDLYTTSNSRYESDDVSDDNDGQDSTRTTMGDVRITVKKPVSATGWDTTDGTGALGESPWNLSNGVRHAATTGNTVVVTMQGLSAGAKDISDAGAYTPLATKVYSVMKRGAGGAGTTEQRLYYNSTQLQWSDLTIALGTSWAVYRSTIGSYLATTGDYHLDILHPSGKGADSYLAEAYLVVAYKVLPALGSASVVSWIW